MSDRTPQQIADQLNSLRAQAVSIVEGTIAGAANPGGSITFTYVNPIDHQPYTATGTAWNQCSPSKVSALKLEDGSWIVVGAHESAIVREAVHTDRRARPKLETGGKIKVLYSVIEGDQRVFYLWGDRPRPKKIGSIPAVGSVFIASIDNRGGNSFIVGVSWATNAATGIFHSQVMGDETWVVDETYDVRSGYDYVGNGFWSKYISGTNIFGGDGPFQIIQPVTKSLYKNQIQTYSGSIATTDSNGVLLTVTESGIRAIAPNVTRLVSSSLSSHIEGSVVITDSYNSSTPFPIVIDKTGNSAVYRVLTGQRVANDNVFSDQYRMITGSSDEVIAGNLPPGQSFISASPTYGAPYRLGTFVNGKYYITKYDDLSKSAWNVDVYTLSANTTKSTIKAKVTYKPTTDKTFHNASYYP